MSVITIQRDINSNVSFVKMQVTDNLATVSQANYIKNNQDSINLLNGGIFGWFITDMLLVAASDGNALFQFIDNTFTSLIIYGEQGSGMVLPGLTNNIAYYPANGTTIGPLATADNGVLVTSSIGAPSISSTLPSAVQLNINQVGTLVNGTWTASVIDVPYGGTGNSSFTPYAVICGGTTSGGNLQSIADVGTAGYLLISNGPGALPTFQNGVASGIINTGALNDLAYYSVNPTGKTLSAITTADNAVLITSGLGVPNWLANSATPGYALVANSGAPPSWQAVGGAFTPAALTESNDTNVTMTLGGTPATALLQAVSMTLGWTGELSLARGGTNANLTASNGGIVYSTATAMAILSGTATAQQLLMSGASTTPQWSTTTYPLTNAINTIMYASSANVLGVITPVNSAVLVSSSGGIPSMSTTLPSGLTIPGYQTSLTLPLVVGQGGTGNTTFTAYSVICAGTTATGTFQNVSGVGTSGQVLTSNGASALPTWQASSGGANFPVNTNITSMTGLTGLIEQPTGIADISGNLVLGFAYAVSPVNYIRISNNATGSPPGFTAIGTDTNIGFNFSTKGSGTYNFAAYANKNILELTTSTSSDVNYVLVSSNATTANPQIGVVGSDANIILQLNGQGTGGVAVQGTSTNDNAPGGYVGQLISSVIATGSAVSYSNATPKDLTSIILTAGDWDVWGNLTFSGSGSVLTGALIWISTTSATIPDASLYSGFNSNAVLMQTYGGAIPQLRFTVSSPTTIYISGDAVFATGTVTGSGGIYARRRR